MSKKRPVLMIRTEPGEPFLVTAFLDSDMDKIHGETLPFIADMVEHLRCMNSGSEAELEFKRVDMTEEELEALPDY